MGNLQCTNTCTSVISLCKRENRIKKGGKDEFSLLNTFYDNKGSFSRKGKSKPAFKKKKNSLVFGTVSTQYIYSFLFIIIDE